MKFSLRLVKHYATKRYGEWKYAPRILNLGVIQQNLPKTDPLYTGNLDKRKINFGTEFFPM